MIELNDGQIKYINKVYSWQKQKYQYGFFKNIVEYANKNKKLSKKQYDNLFYLLKNGKSMYEDGILSTKN